MNEALSEFLQQPCQKRGLPLHRLSINAGLSPGTVHRIINRKYQPTIFSPNRLADYPGVKREYPWQLAGLIEETDHDEEATLADPQLRLSFARLDKLPNRVKRLAVSIIEAVIVFDDST